MLIYESRDLLAPVFMFFAALTDDSRNDIPDKLGYPNYRIGKIQDFK